jgi:hypothetical protein
MPLATGSSRQTTSLPLLPGRLIGRGVNAQTIQICRDGAQMRRGRSAQGERRDFSSLTKCQDVDTNARPRMAGPDRSEAGAEASRSDPYIIRVRSREGERGRSIRGPVYAAKARCKEYLRKGKDKTGPTRAADDGPIKART